jgi:hypothetical protein
MTKLVLLAAAATLGAATPALADRALAFTYEGHRIVGTVTQAGDTQVIKGRDLTDGRDFELKVRNGYVRGSFGSEYVSYPAPKSSVHTPVTSD